MSTDLPMEFGSEPPPPPKRRTGLIAGVVVGVVAAVGLPLGGFAAYNLLSGGGTQPHEALPGDAIAYARVDVDPSASQKINALRLLEKFPAFEEATGIDNPRDDVRKAMFEALKRDTGCDLDFEDDVDPWLGERLGVAAFAPTDGEQEPDVAVAVQVKDEEAARAGIEELLACGDASGEDAGWSFYNDYLIVAETQELADGYAKAAEQAPLSENEAFADDMERLGEQGIASVWFDGRAIVEAVGSTVGGGPAFGSTEQMTKQLERAIERSAVSGAAAFRFDDSHAELAVVVGGKAYQALDDANTVDVDLPDSTAAMIGFADGDRNIAEQWDSMLQMSAGGEDPETLIKEFETETGLQLPADLQTLLGDNFVLSLDSSRLAELVESSDVSALDLGATISTDPAEFAALFDKVRSLAARSGVPLQLATEDIDDGVVVASNPDYARTLADGGALADTAKFQAAVKDARDAQFVGYVDMDAFESMLTEDDPEALDNLRPVEAVGLSASQGDGYAEATLRLTVD